MKLKEIRRDGYYTDGKNVFYKVKGDLIQFIPRGTHNDSYMDVGVWTAIASKRDYENEVRKVVAGEEFLNGDIKVIDAKTVDTFYIDAGITPAQFERGVEPKYRNLREIRRYLNK